MSWQAQTDLQFALVLTNYDNFYDINLKNAF